MATRDEVNAKIRTTNIRGKEYAEVAQRIAAFWEFANDGQIITTLVEDTGQRCTFKAEIYDGGKCVATGFAFESKTGAINSTSYIENCETSAIGRALGIYGIGSSAAIASAEEVANAIEQQETASKTQKSEKASKTTAKRPQKTLSELRSEAFALGMNPNALKGWLSSMFGDAKEYTDEQQRIIAEYLKSYIDNNKEGN